MSHPFTVDLRNRDGLETLVAYIDSPVSTYNKIHKFRSLESQDLDLG